MSSEHYQKRKIEEDFLDQLELSSGMTVGELSKSKKVLIVFLRHLSCIFCREALSDLAKLKVDFAENDVHLTLMHMEERETAMKTLSKYDLGEFDSFSDPSKFWYERFGLEKGSFSQLYGFKNMVRGISKAITLESFGYKVTSDISQMPGVFVIHEGEVVNSFVHQMISDRPDYLQLLGLK